LPKQIAATIKERGKLEIKSEGIADGTTYFVIRPEKKHRTTKHPFWFAVIISLISAVLAVGGKWENRADRRTNETAYKRSV